MIHAQAPGDRQPALTFDGWIKELLFRHGDVFPDAPGFTAQKLLALLGGAQEVMKPHSDDPKVAHMLGRGEFSQERGL